MGWGETRQKVYNLLLLITRQSLEGEDSKVRKPVSESFCLEVAIELTTALAIAGRYHPVDS